jgi:predicted HTH transcriptional regulator
MLLLGKTLNNVDEKDVARLEAEKVPESKRLEYKEALPGSSDEQRKDFLADVSSFANTMGGVIVFGVEEDRDVDGKKLGYPKSIKGLTDIAPDEEIRRLENMCRTGLEPPVSGLAFRVVDVAGKHILLLGIDRSLFAPHLVSFKNDSKFWLRGTSGRQQISVEELRYAFSQMSDWEKEA